MSNAPRAILLVVLLAAFVTGCARHYQITLQNGNRITTAGKPKYDRGFYIYKDLNGRTNAISETRVSIIEPQPRGYKSDSNFNPSKQR